MWLLFRGEAVGSFTLETVQSDFFFPFLSRSHFIVLTDLEPGM